MGINEICQRHIRAGCALIGWNHEELAFRSGLSEHEASLVLKDECEMLGPIQAAFSALSSENIGFFKATEHQAIGVYHADPIPDEILAADLGQCSAKAQHRIVATAGCLVNLKWHELVYLPHRAGLSFPPEQISKDESLGRYCADRISLKLRGCGVSFAPWPDHRTGFGIWLDAKQMPSFHGVPFWPRGSV